MAKADNGPEVKDEKVVDPRECFVIMPIAESQDREPRHFENVYKDLIIPACQMAGFEPRRADETRSSNLIQLEILEKIIKAPMSICDLSSRNPNVLFELGIRQSFDMPVVLIKEIGTPPIFDIQGLRYLEYDKELKYHDIMLKQIELRDAIFETFDNHKNKKDINSIVKLLALSNSASLPTLGVENKKELGFELLKNDLANIKNSVNLILKNNKFSEDLYTTPSLYHRYSLEFEGLKMSIKNKKINDNVACDRLQSLILSVERTSVVEMSNIEVRMFKNLLENIRQFYEDFEIILNS